MEQTHICSASMVLVRGRKNCKAEILFLGLEVCQIKEQLQRSTGKKFFKTVLDPITCEKATAMMQQDKDFIFDDIQKTIGFGVLDGIV